MSVTAELDLSQEAPLQIHNLTSSSAVVNIVLCVWKNKPKQLKQPRKTSLTLAREAGFIV